MAVAVVSKDDAEAFAKGAITTTAAVPSYRYFGLHIGPGGSGKTNILGSMPGKTLILDSEEGTLTLRKKDIDVVHCHNWSEFRKMLRFLEVGDHDYKSIAIDGLSRFQHFDLQFIMAGQSKSFMTIDMWGIALDHFTAMVEYLRTISQIRDMHVAATVLQRVDVDESTGVPYQTLPDLKGGIRERLAPMFDNVSYHFTRELPKEEGMDRGPLQYEALTKPYGTAVNARDRSNVLKQVEILTEPTRGLEDWIERIAATMPESEETKAEPEPEKPKPAEKAPPKAAKAPAKEAKEEPEAAPIPAQDPPAAPEPAETSDAAPVPPEQFHEDILGWYKSVVTDANEDAVNAFLLEKLEALGVETVEELKDVTQLEELLAQCAEFEATLKAE